MGFPMYANVSAEPSDWIHHMLNNSIKLTGLFNMKCVMFEGRKAENDGQGIYI
jgi:hypothetical protein